MRTKEMIEPPITHIGIYHRKTVLTPFRTKEDDGWYDPRGQKAKGLAQDNEMHNYDIRMGTGSFKSEVDGMQLIRVLAIPEGVLQVVRSHLKKPGKLGEVLYAVRNAENGKKTAIQLQNAPKGWDKKFGSKTKGFGSFLNLAVLQHFKKTDATHVRHSFYRTDASRKQHEGHAEQVEWNIEKLEAQLRNNVLQKMGPKALSLLDAP